MAPQTHDEVRQAVQVRYGTIAETRGARTCCDSALVATLDEKAHQVGYAPEETQAVPEGANLGLGCGNPVGSCTPTLRIIRSAQQPAKRLGFYHLILQHGSRQCPRPLPQGQVFVGLEGSPYSPSPCAPSPIPLVRSISCF